MLGAKPVVIFIIINSLFGFRPTKKPSNLMRVTCKVALLLTKLQQVEIFVKYFDLNSIKINWKMCIDNIIKILKFNFLKGLNNYFVETSCFLCFRKLET